MAITIRSISSASNNGSSATISLTTPSGGTAAQVNDTLLIIHGNDYWTASAMPTPTVSPGSPAVGAVTGGSADAGSNLAHIKAYTAVVNSAGAQTVSVTETGPADEEKGLMVLVLAGADTSTPIDAAQGATGTSSTTQTAPAVSPTGSDSLLVTFICSGGGSETASFTKPGSMTNQTDIHITFYSAVLATEQLSASGSTGTRVFTSASAISWAAVTIAVKTGGASTINGTASIAGAGALLATVTQGAGVSPTGAGTVSAAGVIRGTASLTGAGVVSATATQGAAAAPTGAGALAATATQGASAALTGAGTLTAAATGSGGGAAAPGGVGTLTAAATLGAGATPAGAGALTARATQGSGAALAGVGSLTAAGRISGAVAASGAGAMTATVTQQASVAAAGAGSLTASALVLVTGSAVIVGAGQLSATSGKQVIGALDSGAAVTGVDSASASGSRE